MKSFLTWTSPVIWNDTILFIHTPKTAGMSMTSLLCKKLPGPIFVTGPYDEQHRDGKVVYVPGKRHETLMDAASFFANRNMRLEQFEKIFVVMRNPYDLELSRFAYLQKNLPIDRGRAQDIALKGDFREYLAEAPFFGMFPPRLDLYFHLNGAMPENMTILRYERLSSDISRYMQPYLSSFDALPHENKSKHGDSAQVYDEKMENLCFERHRWFFEKSFYARALF